MVSEIIATGPRAVRERRGIGLVWATVGIGVLLGVSLLAVDYGRVQVAKIELRRAADAAARAGAAELLNDPDAAVLLAREYGARHTVDGRSLLILVDDIEIGTWNFSSRSFQPARNENERLNGNAIRVVAELSAARGTAVPAPLSRLTGRTSTDISAESVAVLVDSVAVDQNVQATANPFLAGMPSGSVASRNNPHNSPDYAGTPGNARQSPEAITMPIVPGSVLQFDGIDGVMRHDPNLAYYEPDGQLNSIGRNTNGPENGIADIRGPINALVGVFLSDEAPNRTPAPQYLDFSTPESRDFTELQPKLKQIFFIGDGKDSQGNRQRFVVPDGATRLFLASWDFYEWNNNAGYRNVRITRPGRIVTVK